MQLIAWDYNGSASNEQAMTKDDSLHYKQTFSRVTQIWGVKKIKEK